jgi:hypothetical protein
MLAPPERAAASTPAVRGLGACEALELALAPEQLPGLEAELDELRGAHLEGLAHAAERRDAERVERHRRTLEALARLERRGGGTVAGPAPLVAELARGAALAAAEALTAAVTASERPATLRERATAAAAWAETVAACDELCAIRADYAAHP